MKMRKSSVAAVLLMLVAVMSAGNAESVSSPLRVDDAFPALGGQALTGRQVDLPADAGKGLALVVLAFSRSGGRDAQNWEQHVVKEYPQVAIYNVVFLEAVPRLFRRAAISGIRSGMPAPLHDRTVLLYGDEGLWKQRLQVTDEDHASVILLGSKGHVSWIGAGPFADSGYAALSKVIRSAE